MILNARAKSRSHLRDRMSWRMMDSLTMDSARVMFMAANRVNVAHAVCWMCGTMSSSNGLISCMIPAFWRISTFCQNPKIERFFRFLCKTKNMLRDKEKKIVDIKHAKNTPAFVSLLGLYNTLYAQPSCSLSILINLARIVLRFDWIACNSNSLC